MRRDTDFVLENSPWPALLLEGSGGICRANRVAVHMFGAGIQEPFAKFTALLHEQNAAEIAKFAGGGTCPAKLRLADGQNADFITHATQVDRGGHTYLLLQFFKNSGGHFPELAALAPTQPARPIIPEKPIAPQTSKKPETEAPKPVEKSVAEKFVLENSPWPAFVVRKNGVIQHANRSAIQTFGPAVEKPEAEFGALWLPHNKDSASSFLQTSSDRTMASMRLKSGQPGTFIARSCSDLLDDKVVVQLFKPPATDSAVIPAPPVEVQPPARPPSEGIPVSASPASEGGTAYKQKLECALQLARSVSLDFNNALTSILGHTSLILSKAETDNPWRSSLVEIEKSATRAAEIANDLAAFSRQEKETRGVMAGNLNALLDRAVEPFRVESPSIVWSVQFERKLCTVTVDESKIQQAFGKVLENAAQSIKINGKVSIHTRNLELTEPTQDRTVKLNPGNYVCVEISDNGEGIAPEVMPRIFEPFFTTKGKNHRGLGLAWVYGIVTNHGGGVAVSSQPGVGSSVRIYLPANKKVVKNTTIPGDDLSGDQTILMVDDEDLLLTMGQMILSSFGYTVLTANSGQKALDIFAQAKTPIDLMITDLVMPNMSGRELTEHVQRISPETRILWSSGYTRGANAQEHKTYLQKPFSSQDLLRKVKEVLSE